MRCAWTSNFTSTLHIDLEDGVKRYNLRYDYGHNNATYWKTSKVTLEFTQPLFFIPWANMTFEKEPIILHKTLLLKVKQNNVLMKILYAVFLKAMRLRIKTILQHMVTTMHTSMHLSQCNNKHSYTNLIVNKDSHPPPKKTYAHTCALFYELII